MIHKSLPPREFSPPLCHCAEGRQSPRQPILETDLAPLQVWVLGSFRHGHPTLSPKISVARSQGFPTPREAWISSPWLPHLGTAFRRFQAEAPKWATKLPLEATELGAKSGNSLWCMPPCSESGRILLAEGSFGSRLRKLCLVRMFSTTWPSFWPSAV